MNPHRPQCSPHCDGAVPIQGTAPAASVRVLAACGVLAAILLAAGLAAAQTPPGTVITNTARATFGAGGLDALAVDSNPATVVVTVARTPAELGFLRLAGDATATASLDLPPTTYSASGTELGPFVSVPGTPADGLVDLAAGQTFRQNEPVFLRLEDPDQNLDPAVAELVLVVVVAAATGEREWLRLAETGPASGVFAGYVQARGGTTATVGDGLLTVRAGAEILARYQDPAAPVDEATARALVDPLGLVFSAGTGAAIDGALVTLIDDANGRPAQVLGDDGLSVFPSTVPSGGEVRDSGGAVYSFDPGTYRFPTVAPGLYRLQVQAPAGWVAPAQTASAELQLLPGAPFWLDEAASRGLPFAVVEGPPLRVDIPLDPAGGMLFLTKTAGKAVAAVGEWVPWELRLSNTDLEDAGALTVVDRLPPGFRYEPGSLRVDGRAAADPSVSADGRTLTMAQAGLAAGATLTLRYVTAVLVGTIAGEAAGTARAWHAGLGSNAATGTVLIQDDLFAERSVLLGRVSVEDCAAAGADTTAGVEGVRLYLEDGRAVMTDARGRYHLEGVRPGAHVLQLDTTTLPGRFAAGACAADSDRAEHPFARILDLQPGTTWRTDFLVHEVDPDTGRVSVALAVSLDGRRLAGELEMGAEEVPLRNLRPTVMLPDGVSYLAGSSRLDGAALADPEDRGGVLVWRLGDASAGWSGRLAFAAVVDTIARADLTTAALLIADTPAQTNLRAGPARAVVGLVPEPVRVPGPEVVLRPRFASLAAELDPADLAGIDSLAADLARRQVLAVRVVGHTDSQGIPAGSRAVFADNHALGLARARTVAERLALGLDLDEGQLHVFSRGADEPVADNATAEGRALNRRVVLQAWTESVIHRLPDHPVRDLAAAGTSAVGLRPGERWDRIAAPPTDPDVMPTFDMAWLETAEPGFAFLWPPVGHYPAIPSVKAAVLHEPAWRLALEVNGTAVDRLNCDGTARDAAGRLAVTRWTGVDLIEGDNLLVVVARDTAGTVVAELERVLHYSGPPVRAELVPPASDLAAGGRRPPLVAVRLLDRDGHPARRGVIGRFSVDAPYEALRSRSTAERVRLAELEQREPTYLVGRDGIAEILLEPTTRTGEVQLRLPLAGRTEVLRTWLEPEPRDWILVGLAEGTAGWSAVSGNVEALGAADAAEEFHHDGRVAFFARGRVKGRWLLTTAFDSRAKGDAPADRALGGTIDPDAFYTVYGDASVQGHDAPTAGQLYVRLERREFFALYGDLATGLTVTELGRYNRRLTGAQAGYRAGVWDVAAFASRSGEQYGRDEMMGDGTSGIYRLSHRDLLIGSETVTIEVRDRFRGEVVLSSRRLSRVVDYELDYGRGELVFKEPIFGRDEALNPRWIVVEYETGGESDAATTAGGRVAAHLAGDRVETGVTALHEGDIGGDLVAADARVDLAGGLQVKAEVAGSDRPGAGRAAAWLAEITRRGQQLDARAWLRRREPGFGLGQQRQAEDGTFMTGAEASWRPAPGWTLAGRLARREDLKADAVQDLAEARLNWSRRALSANLGYRHAADSFATGPDRISDQVRGEAALGMLRNRLRLRAGYEHTFDAANASADYPTRATAGAEYDLVREATVEAVQEWTDSGGFDTRSTRLGLRSVPWQGGEARTSVEQQHREGALRVWRNAGLKQTWRLDERWSFDGGIDHARVQGEAPPAVDTGTPPAGGPTAGYTAFSLGATCRGHDWRWSQRLERRSGDDQDKWIIDGAVYVEPSRSVGLQAGLRLDRSDESGARHDRSLARLGLAWRPLDSPWTLLQRLDWRVDDDATASGSLRSRRLVQNLSAVWQERPALQVSGRYGWRYAVETFDGATYEGYTDVLGLEARRCFSQRWDVGLQTAARNSWRQDVHDFSLGASAGVMLLEDLWLSLGWNLRGFRDRDFDAAGWTAQGPYLRFRFRFNQESSRELLP